MHLRFLSRFPAALLLPVGMLLCLPWIGYAQESPEIEGTVTVSTDAGESETLTFGLDPDATDGIDSQLGESERPPLPPGDVFYARWIDDHIDPSTFGEGLHVDIRQGNMSSNGTRKHEIQFQAGDTTATEVVIEWNLPTGVSGTIESESGSDYGPVEMTGNGSLTVNPGDPEALLTIDYNDAPSLDVNEGITLDEGGQAAIPADSLSASDPDHDPSSLTFTVTDGPAEGGLLVGDAPATSFTQADLEDGNVEYSHSGSETTADEFTFDLTDGAGAGPSGRTFDISINPVNDAPTFESEVSDKAINEDETAGPYSFTISDAETEASNLTLSGTSDSTDLVPSGNIQLGGSGEDRTVTVTPRPDSNGTVGIELTVSDGDKSGSTTFNLAVQSVNDSPVASDDDYSVTEGQTLQVDSEEDGVLDNDSDPDEDNLEASLVSGVSDGELTLDPDGTFEYVPNEGFTGTDEFTYEAADGNGGTGQATASIDVSESDPTPTPDPNDPPVASDDDYSVTEGQTLQVDSEEDGVLGNDSDPDGDDLGASLVSGVSDGELTLEASGAFEYVPDEGFAGTDGFTYQAADGNGGTDQASVTISVEANQPPSISALPDATIEEDGALGPVEFSVSDQETAPENLSLEVETGNPDLVPSDSISLSGPEPDSTASVRAAPRADSNGTAELRLIVSEELPGGTAQRDTSAFVLTVEPVNDPPVARADTFSVPAGSTLTASASEGTLANDSDPDGDDLEASLVSGVSDGELTLEANGAFEYVPDPGFDGTDSFAYEAADGNGGTDQATVTLEVNGVGTLTLEDGWNLVSLPYQPEDPTFGSVLPSCTSGFLYDSGSGNQPIEDGDPVPIGEGFWADCPSGTAQVTGQRVDSQDISVTAGWNLIGPRADSADVGAISSEPSGIITSSVYKFSLSDGYTPVSTLVPGDGHWVNVSQSGTLTFGGESATNGLAAGLHQQNVGGNGKIVSIQVTDSQGREATLRLRRGSPPAEKQGYELPPVPPRGTFDIRFTNGASFATVEANVGGASFQDVRLQGVEYPLTLRLQGASPSHGVEVRQSQGPEAKVATLSSSAPSMTLQDGNGRLQVSLRDVPGQFSLRRSAPNPASEQSTITFSVPEQARVEIALFDVLGRQVRTLTDAEKTPGQYDVRLDVQSLSSGTYFYRMSADGFSETRRLQVVR